MRIFLFILSVFILFVGIFIPSDIFATYEIYQMAQMVILLIGALFTLYNHAVLLLKIPNDPTIEDFRMYQWGATFAICVIFFFIISISVGISKHIPLKNIDSYPDILIPNILLSVYLGCFFYEIIIAIITIEKSQSS